MARNRSIRNRGKLRRMKEPFDLDITSLLDILVILLVFLIKSYSSSAVVINVPKGIELPTSASPSINSEGIIIQVSEDKIYVDDEEVLDSNNLPDKIYDHGKRRIIPLYNKLREKIDLIKQTELSSENAKKFSGKANLVIDKSIKFDYMKKLMYTCAVAGFKEYKFVVLSNQQ